MKKLEIFEPAVCASDGMCGLSVDQQLMLIDTAVKVLQSSAYNINRYIQPDDREAFLGNEVVVKFLREKTEAGLPLTLLDNQIVKSGSYPTLDEIAKWLEVPNMDELMK